MGVNPRASEARPAISAGRDVRVQRLDELRRAERARRPKRPV
jgi:hypothetical protein